MKEVILKKSLLLFTKRGLRSVTMDDIAGELGISKKTIYTHYSSKDELINATFKVAIERAALKIREVVNVSENPIQEMFDVKEGLNELFGMSNDKPKVVFEINKYYPEIAEKILNVRIKEYEFSIVRNLKKGIADGLYRKDIDVDFVGKNYFVSTTSFCNEEFDQIDVNHNIDQIHLLQIEYHLRSIVTDKGLNILNRILQTQ